MLCEYLESEGCTVTTANNGREALNCIDNAHHDILVLDIMMPQMTGIDVLKQLRSTSILPVIMLTARGDDLDRILGLELGADDYIPKPCNPRELVARIRAVLRRSQTTMGMTPDKIELDDLSIDPASRGVTIILDGEKSSLSLTQTEFDLLHLLLSNINKQVTKSEMSLKVLEKPLSQWDRSLDVHISNLRKKLGRYPSGKERVYTLRGSGYMYQSEDVKL